MREELLSIGDDYWIQDESGARAFNVDGKALQILDTFVLREATGQEAAEIKDANCGVRESMKIERPGADANCPCGRARLSAP